MLQFYDLVKMGLGLDQNATSMTGTSSQKNNDQVIGSLHLFSLEVDKEKKKVPNIYGTPKFHKHASKARVIIFLHQYSIKQLFNVVVAILKLTHQKLFADGLFIFNIVKNKNDKDFTHDLSLISKWVFKWKMLFNPYPTKPVQDLIFSSKKDDSPHLNMFLMIYQSKELHTKNILEFILTKN